MIEYFEDKRGKWRFRIKGRNHEKIVTSEGYASRANALRGFEDLRAAIASITDIYEEPRP